MTWFFVRHGQSTYNLENRFTGWHNPSLSELGEKQATETARKLSEYNIDVIYTSDLLNERNNVEWAGKNKEQLKGEIGEDNFLKVRRGWDSPPENGESLKDTADRVKKWVDELKEEHSNNENVLVVSHGNTIRAISVILEINTKEPRLAKSTNKIYS